MILIKSAGGAERRFCLWIRPDDVHKLNQRLNSEINDETNKACIHAAHEQARLALRALLKRLRRSSEGQA